MSYDEEPEDQHGECAAEIAQLRAQLETARGLLAEASPFIGWSSKPDGLIERVDAFLAAVPVQHVAPVAGDGALNHRRSVLREVVEALEDDGTMETWSLGLCAARDRVREMLADTPEVGPAPTPDAAGTPVTAAFDARLATPGGRGRAGRPEKSRHLPR